MRLLILYETVYPDSIGGVESRNYELAAALVRRGHEVTLGGFCTGLAGEPPGLRIHSLGDLARLYNAAGKRSTRHALRFAAAAARLDLGRYDLVETANMPYVHLLPLAWKCARAGKPLLVTWYEYWAGYWRGYVGRWRAPAYRAVEWLTAQVGSEVTATSDLTRRRLAAARLRRGHVEMVPCGIDVARVRAAAGAPGEGPPLIYLGRILEHKRLDLLLEAVRLLVNGSGGAGSGPGGTGDHQPLLTVFGEGPERGRLERLAGELGIAERVVFRGHVESNDEVWRELGRARLAVQPSLREGFGLFPLEAMAAGLPVVYCASPESAVGELVRDGIEGVSVPPEPAALAATLAALLGAPDERQRLGRNALARADQFDWAEIAQRIEEICAALSARSRR
ncbi:MAG TPA: glycosyltransferase family 4 protein [Thermoanaerobaculia bacterium]|nr:glycosyltransferase family 4 protein [Thermoanaerobaculia bacterium]